MNQLKNLIIRCGFIVPLHYIYSIYIDKIIYNNEINNFNFNQLLVKYSFENFIIFIFEIVFLTWILLFDGLKKNKQQNSIRDNFKDKYDIEIKFALILIVFIIWTLVYLVGFKDFHLNFIETLICVLISYPILKYLNFFKKSVLKTSYYFIMFVMSFQIIS